jgi:hypothetical protein
MQSEVIREIHLTSLSGLGSSYKLRGYFLLRTNENDKEEHKIMFKGVAFGGLYGGHNVNVEISRISKRKIMDLLGKGKSDGEREVDELLSEVQRRILQGDMVVEFEKIKQQEPRSDLN